SCARARCSRRGRDFEAAAVEKAPDPPRGGSFMCICEQLTGTWARYASSEEHDHECKPSPHRHTSASTSVAKAEQAARADCGSTADRTGCARSKGAANLFTIPLDEDRETTSRGGLAAGQNAGR